jgi:eukaryotic-like serine/threonine-protein kinase
VVQRDLKPGNVKVKPDGAVKVLDFGLAKACATPSALGEASTLTMGMIEAGRVLGTAPYMSPEQASGKPVDKRSDIWAFGVVLWEMLTGKRLFAGETTPDTLAQVLEGAINLEQFPKETPPGIRNLVRRCLERDARSRLRDIGEARITLQACLAGSTEPTAAERAAAGAKRSGLIWTLAAGLALCAAIAGWALWPKPAPPVHAMRLEIPLPEGVSSVLYAPLSPDGRKLLINTLGAQGLFVRDLDALEWRHLPDTSGAAAPFWSPDSKFVAFGIGNQLKKIDISGGPPQILCTVQNSVASGVWNREGKIVFGSAGKGPLYMVSDAGGTPSEVTAVDSERGETFHTSLSLLPDGKRFLYFRQGPAGVGGVYAGSIGGKPGEQSRRRILSSRFGAAYADGNLFFTRGDALMAQPFDSGRLELKGEPVLVADNVDSLGVDGIFSVSSGGILAYRGLGPAPRHFQFTWFDRQGKSGDAFGEPISGWGLALSPDGGRAAFRDSDSLHPGDLWTIDFARGIRTRLTFRQSFSRPVVWSSDGTRVIFTAGTNSITDAFYEKASSGAGDEKELFSQAGQNIVPTSWSRDGRFLLYHTTGTTPSDDVWVLPMEGDRKPVPLLVEKFNERVGSFSPDGRWIAYKSDETGRWEIYVRQFVAAGPSGALSLGGGKWQISRDGAAHDARDVRVGFPRWRADGKEILFGGPNGAVMSVEVDTNGGNFQPGVAKRLFTLPPGAGGWDVTPDGKKILAPVAQTAQASPTPITVVLNWRAELSR